MKWIRRITCLFVLSCAVCSPARTTAPHRMTVADLPPLVRLRRLHLVRPDLIPYPLDIEVVC